jgi:hypothetical protein
LASANRSLVSNNDTKKLHVTCSNRGKKSKKVDLSLWVGGERLLYATDTHSPLTDGAVALVVSSQDKSVEAQFDNFSLRRI